LSAVVFSDPTRMINIHLANLKRSGELVSLASDAAIERFGKHLSEWDLGTHPDIAGAAYARSPAIHKDKASKIEQEKIRKRSREGESGCDKSTSMGALVGEEEGRCSHGVEADRRIKVKGSGGGPLGSAEEARAFTNLSSVLLQANYMGVPVNPFLPPVLTAALDNLAPPTLSAEHPSGASFALTAPTTTTSSVVEFAASSITSRWLAARWARAERVFNTLGNAEFRSVSPNARSHVLMLYAALSVGDVARGARVLEDLCSPSRGGVPREDLYSVLQPSMLHALVRAGVMTAADVSSQLTASPDTPKFFFLKAAFEASRGDQFGSKHGAVLARGGKYLSHGRNHRFGTEGSSHVRVMHSEVHCVCKLKSLEEARGGEFWIVELDGVGVGYEEAVACIMCTKGATRLGVVAQHFSSHSGVKSLKIGHKGDQGITCESLDMALARSYPENTTNPDLLDTPGFDFSDHCTVGDPGRGREAMDLAEARRNTLASNAYTAT